MHACVLWQFHWQVMDKLISGFGQDVLDSLYWTAVEPRGRKREHFGTIFHLIFAIVYVGILFFQWIAPPPDTHMRAYTFVSPLPYSYDNPFLFFSLSFKVMIMLALSYPLHVLYLFLTYILQSHHINGLSDFKQSSLCLHVSLLLESETSWCVVLSRKFLAETRSRKNCDFIYYIFGFSLT